MQESDKVTTEEVLSKAGSSGRFQIFLFIVVTYIEVTWAAFSGGSYLFLIAEPRWKCSANSTLCNITGTVGPGEDHYKYRCGIPRQEWTFVDEYTSFVTQFDLICDKSMYGSIIVTIVSVGSAVGVILVGMISDWFGRRTAIFLSGLIVSSILLYLRFSRSFWMVVVPMFIFGIGQYGALFTGLVYIVEFVGIEQRPLYGNLFWTSYGLGFVVFAGIAYLSREWKTLVLILGLCGLPGLVLCWLAPESLRWLIVQGKEEQARKTLQLISKINKKEVPHDITLPRYSKTEKSSHDIRLLFRGNFAKYTPVIWFAFFANAMIYTGLYLIAPNIGGSIYLNWFLAGVTEIFSAGLGSWIHSRVKRKKATAGCLAFAALSSFVAGFLLFYDDGSTGFLVGKVLTALVLLKFFTSIGINGLNLIIAELYPTVIRNTAQGAAACWGAMSTMTSAYVTYLIRFNPFLPFGIMGFTAALGSILVLKVLKETSQDAVPEIFPEDETEENEMAKLLNK